MRIIFKIFVILIVGFILLVILTRGSIFIYLQNQFAELRCKDANHYIKYQGFGGQPICITIFSDGGTPCRGGSDCESGNCLISADTYTQLLTDNLLIETELSEFSVGLPAGKLKEPANRYLVTCTEDSSPLCGTNLHVITRDNNVNVGIDCE
jgi:hypothetical protein